MRIVLKEITINKYIFDIECIPGCLNATLVQNTVCAIYMIPVISTYLTYIVRKFVDMNK